MNDRKLFRSKWIHPLFTEMFVFTFRCCDLWTVVNMSHFVIPSLSCYLFEILRLMVWDYLYESYGFFFSRGYDKNRFRIKRVYSRQKQYIKTCVVRGNEEIILNYQFDITTNSTTIYSFHSCLNTIDMLNILIITIFIILFVHALSHYPIKYAIFSRFVPDHIPEVTNY